MKKIYFILLLLTIPMFNMVAQEAKLKAAFTQNFIRYIGWPDQSMQGDFVIAVVRSREVANWIREQSEGKKFGFQDIVVKEYRNIEEVEQAQVIFISSGVNLRGSSEALIEKARKFNSLVVSESEGATAYGSSINFVVRDNVLKFELHKGNAAWMGLQFSARLESMAAAINL